MNRINKLLYNDEYFAGFHWLLGIIIMGIIYFIILCSGIVPVDKVASLVNSNVISLSATIAGFELTGVTLLISLNGNQKFRSIKEIGSDKTIYKLFFYSIILLTISLLVMTIDINILEFVPNGYLNVKKSIEYISVVLFVQGIVFFLSSVRMLLLIFK